MFMLKKIYEKELHKPGKDTLKYGKYFTLSNFNFEENPILDWLYIALFRHQTSSNYLFGCIP